MPDPEALAGALVALRNVLQGSPAGQARAVAGMAKQILRDLSRSTRGATRTRGPSWSGKGAAPTS
ncbi:MAG: hypothetical protein M3R38_33890 [Actinomycetota bacterium]|nr:hypothetical protein [Actinomycetota bacterium]